MTSKKVGSVLYIEMRKHSHTAQVIVLPPVHNPVNAKDEPMRLLTRQISVANPRRSWRFYTSTIRTENMPTDSISVAALSVVPLINDIAPYVSGFISGGWEVYKNPVAVEMSTDDITEVASGNTPSALIRRIQRTRVEAGYEEALFTTTY